jgi:hypothetical protein
MVAVSSPKNLDIETIDVAFSLHCFSQEFFWIDVIPL